MTVQFPAKLAFLFKPARFKVLHGGRDGGKSWGVARALLEIGASRKEFIVCARETMESIRDSVHRLLESQIAALGLGDQYVVEKSRIWHRHTGTEFVFKGLFNNPDAIKSLEGATIVWVEEAQSVSASSWRIVTPTVRRPGSEIWITLNPRLETDATYQNFVVKPPPDSVVVQMNFSDNPWASEVLRAEREQMEIDEPDTYSNIWLGLPLQTLAGAIYENEMRSADRMGRVTRVPYDPSRPVHTAWDIGWGDNTAIWMFQQFPFEWRFIDFEQGNQKDIASWIQILQKRNYTWGTDYLPWDTANMVFRTAIQQTMRQFGRTAQILDRGPRQVGIDKARAKLALSWFDAEKCADGLNALRQYRYAEIQKLSIPGQTAYSREPLHDWASHPADGYRTFACGVDLPKPGPAPDPNKRTSPPRRIGGYAPFS